MDEAVETVPKGEATGAAKEHMSDATVDVLLAMRAQFLATGASALKHWDQLAEAMKSAVRRSSGPETWVSTMGARLRLESPSSDLSAKSVALVETVRRYDVRAWLALVESEGVYLLARARTLAEERREARLTEAEKQGMAARDAAEGTT